jgi:hypothetical protein
MREIFSSLVENLSRAGLGVKHRFRPCRHAFVSGRPVLIWRSARVTSLLKSVAEKWHAAGVLHARCAIAPN